MLQEDNDSSHGTRSRDNVARRYKDINWIDTLLHPAQSPDLNPIEAVWNILKQRVRRRSSSCGSLEEFQALIIEEWEKITLDEIRTRIREMPERCRKLVATGGECIKSTLW
jgi:replicative DNA helicase